MLAFYAGIFITVSLIAYGFLAVYSGKRIVVQRRIQTYLLNNTPVVESAVAAEEDLSFKERVIAPAWKKMKRKYTKRLSEKEATKLEVKLLQAGQPFGLTPVSFKMLQIVLTIALPAIGAGYSLLLDVSVLITLVLGLGGLAVAVLLPKYYLKSKIEARSKEAEKSLPDILDLLTISLEAGLGFDAAISQVVAKKKGVLANEFKVTLEEMRLGKTRKQALTAMNERIQSEDLKTLIYSIVQAEKLGIGMVTVLRVQTEDIRERRRQRAEEAAMKAPIKMMFPLVFFIFPTLFVILLGPAIIQFMDAM
ncbi:type II secretion system F family protein [Virgibacillus kekensis]|uniref:Type II secretion system F family protein n=1 Tax=Virgibacillus kekensis TaxID=202261 RepID=A0ABV9DFM2_9BACI